MKKRHIGALVALAIGVGVGMTQQPVSAAETPTYYQVTNQQAASAVVQINQQQRNDGLFAAGPYRTNAQTTRPNASAKSRNGQYATMIMTATTPTGNWAQLRFGDGQVMWLDARGVKPVAVNAVTGSRQVQQTAILAQSSRSDGLFVSGPYRTSAATMKPAASAKSRNGQAVTILAYAQAGGVQWAQIQTADRGIYWIDVRGLTVVALNPVTGKQSLTQTGMINQGSRNDGLFVGGPYKSSATSLKPVAFAGAYRGQGVAVVGQAQSGGHGWFEIRLNSGQTYWIDARGVSLVTLNAVTGSQALNKTGIIGQGSRNDGLFAGGPYKSSTTSLKPAAFTSAYRGQGIAVIGQAQSGGHGWYQIRLNNGQVYWVDSRAVQLVTLYPVISRSSVANARAIVTQNKRSDGLFIKGPYHSTLQILKPDASACNLNGQVVEVIAQAKTAIATWKQIRTNTGKTYWIDARGLVATNYYMITNYKAQNWQGQINQGSRNDGLFANGPYKTSSTTNHPNASAQLQWPASYRGCLCNH